jgi:hypothetical protein
VKKETLAEYVARGGKITRVPAVRPTTTTESVHSTVSNTPATIMTLQEGSLYYGERKKGTIAGSKKVKKPAANIDLSALPEKLRKKYVDGVIKKSE